MLSFPDDGSLSVPTAFDIDHTYTLACTKTCSLFRSASWPVPSPAAPIIAHSGGVVQGATGVGGENHWHLRLCEPSLRRVLFFDYSDGGGRLHQSRPRGASKKLTPRPPETVGWRCTFSHETGSQAVCQTREKMRVAGQRSQHGCVAGIPPTPEASTSGRFHPVQIIRAR